MYDNSRFSFWAALTVFILTFILSWSVLLPARLCIMFSLTTGLLTWLVCTVHILRRRCTAMELSIDQALRKADKLKLELDSLKCTSAPPASEGGKAR